MKGNKGITLIALVITIIVLLILAGVSIAMLSGDNSILSRSRDAGLKTDLGSAKEQIGLAVSEAVTDYYKSAYVDSTTTTLQEQIDTKLTSLIGTTGTANANLYNGVKVTYTAPTLADGKTIKDATASDKGSISIVYTGDTKYSYTGSLDYTTGKIEWKDQDNKVIK